MNEITGLVPVKRRSGWTEVQLDGASLCRLPDDDVYRLRLEVGLQLAPAGVDAVQAAAGRAEAMLVGLRYLSVRPRSRREVERRLRRDRIDRAAVQHVLERLEALGYLDDAKFAASFARDRIRLRPCGIRRMQSDLFARGVSGEASDRGIREAMAEEAATEETLLEQAATSRARRLAGADPAKARRRLFDYLARRGFAAESIRAWIDANWQDGDDTAG